MPGSCFFSRVTLVKLLKLSLSLYSEHEMMATNCSFRRGCLLNEIIHVVCAKVLDKW